MNLKKQGSNVECENCKSLLEIVSTSVIEVKELKAALDKLQNTPVVEEKVIESHQRADEAWKTDIEERIESRTNRQLRQTLVFRGIPEEKEGESWERTKDQHNPVHTKSVQPEEKVYEIV